MKKRLFAVLTSALVLAAIGLPALVLEPSAAETLPLIYETETKLENNEQITYAPSSAVQVTGNALSMRVFVKNTYNYWLPVGLKATTSAGATYEWSDLKALTAYEIDEKGAAEGTKVSRSTAEQSLGAAEIAEHFYGDIVFPFSSLTSAPADIASVTVTITASRYSSFASGDTWVTDTVSLYLFGIDCVTVTESGVTTAEPIVDFRGMPASGVTLSGVASGQTVYGNVRAATSDDDTVFRAILAENYADAEWLGDIKLVENFDLNPTIAALSTQRATAEMEKAFVQSGQISDLSISASGAYGGTALHYSLDSLKYVAGANSYAGVHFNFASKDAKNWSGAKGVTVYVENTADHIVSFAVEIFQFNSDTGKLEQYNLNDAGNKYKTLYAYNVETGEEFSYHTQTYMRIPANFKGWIRIPFSQYAAPEWSKAAAWGNMGVLDFGKYEVYKISLTRLFNVNQDTELIIDNIGIYYSDFTLGGLFNSELPSIKSCVENGGNYRAN